MCHPAQPTVGCCGWRQQDTEDLSPEESLKILTSPRDALKASQLKAQINKKHDVAFTGCRTTSYISIFRPVLLPAPYHHTCNPAPAAQRLLNADTRESNNETDGIPGDFTPMHLAKIFSIPHSQAYYQHCLTKAKNLGSVAMLLLAE